MHTQTSRCHWCDRAENLVFDKAPDKWIYIPSWYRVSGGISNGGLGGDREYCRLACLKAWVMSL